MPSKLIKIKKGVQAVIPIIQHGAAALGSVVPAGVEGVKMRKPPQYVVLEPVTAASP
jgi:hypothetical protein